MLEAVRIACQRLTQLRGDVDTALARGAAEAAVRARDQTLLEREKDIKFLEVRLGRAEAALDKAEGELKNANDKCILCLSLIHPTWLNGSAGWVQTAGARRQSGAG
jgi:Tfp pilus assembly protein PilX